MKRSHLALAFLVLLSTTLSMTALAQTASPTPSATPKPLGRTTNKTKVIVRKGMVVKNARNKPMPAASPAPGAPANSVPPVAAVPAPPPNPWHLVFYAEYQGPRLSNIDLGKTEDDTGAISGAAIASFTQVGYSVAKNVVLGARIRYSYSVDPDNTGSAFQWSNQRLYANWSHMIETKDLDMSGQIDFELPTTDAARTAGLILALNIKNNWTLKTSLRNWSFSALTIIRPLFYNTVSSSTDIGFEIDPDIVVDLSANWQFQVEGYFSAAHSGQAAYFDFNQSDSDTIDVGPLWNINAHYSLYPALRFYTGAFSFKDANIYINFTAAL